MAEPQMRRKYPFDQIEPKWQRYWLENKTFATREELYMWVMQFHPTNWRGALKTVEQ